MEPASISRERPSVRTTILLTPSEHRAWTAQARHRGLSMTELLRQRMADAENAPTLEQQVELEYWAAELPAIVARMERNLQEAHETIRDALDPRHDAVARERVAAELAANPVEIDLDFGGGAPSRPAAL